MSKKQKIHVKIGDTVRIISGFSKNEIGEVIKINRKTGTKSFRNIESSFE